MSPRTWRSRARAVMTVVLVGGGLAAVPALAVEAYYWNGFIYSGAYHWGSKQYVTYNSARKVGRSDTLVCTMTAQSFSQGKPVADSEIRCTQVQDGLVTHSYCGCVPRWPVIYATGPGGGTDARALARW